MKKYKYTVDFEDKTESYSGTTEAPSWEHARIKVEQFWGKQAPIKNVVVESLSKKK